MKTCERTIPRHRRKNDVSKERYAFAAANDWESTLTLKTLLNKEKHAANLLRNDINSLIRIARDIYESDRKMSLTCCIEKKHGSIPGTGIGGDIALALMSRMGGTSAVIRIQRWSRCCKSISVPKCILRACQTLVAMIMAGS
jgi:hypothetical protein